MICPSTDTNQGASSFCLSTEYSDPYYFLLVWHDILTHFLFLFEFFVSIPLITEFTLPDSFYVYYFVYFLNIFSKRGK